MFSATSEEKNEAVEEKADDLMDKKIPEKDVLSKKTTNNTETSIYVKNTGKNKKQKVEVPEKPKKTYKPISEKKKNRVINDKKKYFKTKPASSKKKTMPKKGPKKGPKKFNKK